MSSKSIARRVAGSSIILVLAVFALATLFNYGFFTYQAERTNRKNLQAKLDHISDSVTVLVASDDNATLANVANSFADEKEVAQLRIFSTTSGKPVYEKVKFTSPDVLVGSAQLVFDGATVGVVELGLLMEEYTQTRNALFLYGFLMAILISATLAWGLNSFVRNYLEEPLETLEKWTKSLAEGDYDVGVSSIREKELQKVAEKFIEMAEKVKSRERLLSESERKFRDLAELLPQALFETDTEGRITYLNRFGINHFEYDRADLEAGVNVLDLIAPREKEKGRENMRLRFMGERVADNEYEMVSKTGRSFPVLVYSTVIRDDGDPAGLRGIIIDISERKKLQDQLVQSQKMEAIGTLASGIAHDFNNLLQMISGYSEYLLMNRSRNPEDRAGINRIREAAMMAASLVQRILSFSRKKEPEADKIDLNALVVRTSEMLGRTIPKMIEIRTDLARDLDPIYADPGQIDQVLLNLALNARDAMPEGGVLTMKTMNVVPGEEFCEKEQIKPGTYALLEVVDSGIGMDEETLSHVFEPFFTTKEEGKGTGLGLSSVFGIARSHGGAVVCSSMPGKGSVFSVYLPSRRERDINAAAEEAHSELREQDAAREGKGTILIVDDEEIVRELARSMFERKGYRVVEASDGEGAIRLYRESLSSGGRSGFGAVVLDLGMPGMGGMKCMEEIILLDPEARILVATGYSVINHADVLLKAGALGLITKPYKLTELVKKVESIL